MDDVHRFDRDSDEIARIRQIVEAQPFPDFILGFDVRLGEYDDAPAMWIIFQTIGHRPTGPEAMQELGQALGGFRESVHRRLLETVPDRYPYYRFRDADLVATAAH